MGMVRLRKAECGVTDDTVFVTGSITRITQVEQVRLQMVLPGRHQKTVDRGAAACLFMA
jgi:hypothetical protein